MSGAANSIGSLPGRATSGQGGAPQTAVTAASEALRTVSAVTNALTNTAGVSANLGFSKSRSETASQEQVVVGSNVAGENVRLTARDDVTVRGSTVTATNDATLTAGRDVILQSAQNRLDTQNKSSSSGASLGVNVGVGIVGGVSAGASANFNASRSSGRTSETTQTNASVAAGGTLGITSGRDTTLSGAVAEGRDVLVNVGRDLTIQSVQDTASRSSSSAGVNIGVSYSPTPGVSGIGANGGISVGTGSARSAVVAEQSAIVARGGSLSATVGNATTVNGGVLGAVDADGKDSGKLALNTRTLTVTDIADRAKSRDISVGVSANVNDPFEQGIKGADTPVLDGSYASSTFRQNTRGTIGRGQIVVAVPEGSTAIAGINRDLGAAQVVTEDKRSGFTVYADEAAIREVGALATGDTANSVILQGAVQLATNPLKPVDDVIAEIASLSDSKPESGAIDRLLGQADRLLRGDQKVRESQARTIANDSRFADRSPEQVAEIRNADAIEAVRAAYGDEKAAAFETLLATPEGRRLSEAAAAVLIGYRDADGDLAAVKDKIVPGSLRADGGGVANAGTSATGGPGELTVLGSAPTFGDRTVSVLAGAGKLINKIPPELQEASTFGIGVLVGGPVAALGGYFIGKAVETGINNSELAKQGVQTVTREAGLLGVSSLSSSTLAENREDATFTGYSEGDNLLVAAGTLLSIGVIKKLIDRGGSSSSSTETGGDDTDADTLDRTPLNEPEANFAGNGNPRPDLIDHLENGKVQGKQISGGHNEANFNVTLQSVGGAVISRKELAPGISEVRYILPNGKPFVKTVYDPAVHPSMPRLADTAANQGLRQFQLTGSKQQDITVEGVVFRVVVRETLGESPSILTVYPIGIKR